MGTHPRVALPHSVALSKALPCLALVSPAVKCVSGLLATPPDPGLISLSSSFSEHPTCGSCTLIALLGPQAWPFCPFPVKHSCLERSRTVDSYLVLLLPCLLEPPLCGWWVWAGGKCYVEGVEGKRLYLLHQVPLGNFPSLTNGAQRPCPLIWGPP